MTRSSSRSRTHSAKRSCWASPSSESSGVPVPASSRAFSGTFIHESSVSALTSSPYCERRKLGWIVDQNLHASFDAGLNKERLNVEVGLAHLTQRGLDGRHH